MLLIFYCWTHTVSERDTLLTSWPAEAHDEHWESFRLRFHGFFQELLTKTSSPDFAQRGYKDLIVGGKEHNQVFCFTTDHLNHDITVPCPSRLLSGNVREWRHKPVQCFYQIWNQPPDMSYLPLLAGLFFFQHPAPKACPRCFSALSFCSFCALAGEPKSLNTVVKQCCPVWSGSATEWQFKPCESDRKSELETQQKVHAVATSKWYAWRFYHLIQKRCL